MKTKIKKKPSAPSTQQYLDVASIQDDAVILKDGTLRAVLLVSSLNFALKSEDEQQGLVANYVSFLNSLDHPLQVVVQSRKMRVDNYVAELKAQEEKTGNMLLREQIRDYVGFVTDLIELGDIMQKRFFVVVPYDPVGNKQKSFMDRLKEVLKPAKVIKLKTAEYEERVKQLNLRAERVTSNLQSMGLKVARLDTQGLIEVFYSSYNPEISQSEKMVDTEKISLEEQPAGAQ